MSATVAIVYFDAGGGHRNAANALRSVIVEQDRGWDVRLTNLQELLDDMDVVRKLTGKRVQDVYNLMLQRGWTLGAAELLPMLHGLIRLMQPRLVRVLESHWKAERPDMVISVVPNLNRPLARSVRTAIPGVPFVTVLTDLADYPPHFWVEKHPPAYAARRALTSRDAGIPWSKRAGGRLRAPAEPGKCSHCPRFGCKSHSILEIRHFRRRDRRVKKAAFFNLAVTIHA